MKKILLLVVVVCYCHNLISQTNKKIQDGFYEVVKASNKKNHTDTLIRNTATIGFNKHFLENAPADASRLVIYTNEFVPLQLKKLPELENSTELKSKLRINLTDMSAEKLRSFTKARVLKQMVIVMNGEALTMHQIKEPLSGDGFEITGCSKEACEKLNVRFKEYFKK